MSAAQELCARCGHDRRDHRSRRASAKQRCTARVGTGMYKPCGHMQQQRTEPCKCPDFQEPTP